MKKTIKRTIVERALAGIMTILMIITACPETSLAKRIDEVEAK